MLVSNSSSRRSFQGALSFGPRRGDTLTMPCAIAVDDSATSTKNKTRGTMVAPWRANPA